MLKPFHENAEANRAGDFRSGILSLVGFSASALSPLHAFSGIYAKSVSHRYLADVPFLDNFYVVPPFYDRADLAGDEATKRRRGKAMRNAPTGPEPITPARSETSSIRALVGLGVLQVILLLAVLALAIRILLKEDSRSKEQPDSTIPVEKILGQLAQLQKKPGQPIDTKPARENPAGLTFDSVAVLPTRSKIDAIADAEAAKVSPALTFLLDKNKRLKVIPFEKVKELPEKTDPTKAAKTLDVGALLVLELYTKDFVRLNIFLKVELVETKTGLALLAETIDLGEYSGPEWKQKLTQAIGKVVTETEACLASNP